jgi:UDP-sugar transporter A1/2/3
MQVCGIPIGYFILVLLIFQNSAHTLTTRYSLGIRHDQYSLSSVVIVVELAKLVFSILMMAKTQTSEKSLKDYLYEQTVSSAPMAIPALVYFVQKLLSFKGLENLDPTIYAIVTQLKLLTTAIFSVMMLNKHLSPRKWRALLLLVIGVVVIQLASQAHAKTSGQTGDATFGMLCALGIACLSGFAGVYIEKMLKSTSLSIWDSNYQLSLYGLAMAIVYVMLFDLEPLQTKGFFYGWDALTWVIVVIFAFGGILVAMVGKYASMILKGEAAHATPHHTSQEHNPRTNAVLGPLRLCNGLSHHQHCTLELLLVRWYPLLALLANIFLRYLPHCPSGILTTLFGMGVCVVIISLFNYNEAEVNQAPVEAAKSSDDETSQNGSLMTTP